MPHPSQVQADAHIHCVTMHSRVVITVLAILAAVWAFSTVAHAAERPAIQAGEAIANLEQAERTRVEQALRRESFTLVGEVRRKGQLVIVTAVQQGVPWRLVIEGGSGEIIGRRPLAETAAFPR
jgi:hypothetical protein